jgi:hypothetical protein
MINIKGLFFNNQIGKKKPYLSNIGTENLDILLMRKLQSDEDQTSLFEIHFLVLYKVI